MKAPDVIFLQWHGDAPTTYLDDDDNEVEIPEDEMEGPSADDYYSEDVTWCVERIYDADIPYRRVTTCVWVQDDDDHGIKWYRSPHGERAPEDQIADWPYCRGCGGRIEVKQ